MNNEYAENGYENIRHLVEAAATYIRDTFGPQDGE